MPFIYGFLFAICLAIVILVVLFIFLGIIGFFYRIKSWLRNIFIFPSAKKYARIFESKLWENQAERLQAEELEKEELNRKNILKKYAATDERFLDGLLQMTNKLINSVKLITVEKDSEKQSNYFFIKIGRNANIKQVYLAGMPVGRKFSVEKKQKTVLHIDKLFETVNVLHRSGFSDLFFRNISDSDRILSNKESE